MKINLNDYINSPQPTPICDQLSRELNLALSTFLNGRSKTGLTPGMNLERKEIQDLAKELSQFGHDKEEIYRMFAKQRSEIYLHNLRLGLLLPPNNCLERADYMAYLKGEL